MSTTNEQAPSTEAPPTNTDASAPTSAEALTAFDILDSSKDGVLTKEEFITTLKHYDKTMSDDNALTEWNNYLKKKDINNNGELSKGELIYGLNDSQDITRESECVKGMGQEEREMFFKKYDKNEDGKVTNEEIQKVDNEQKKMTAGDIALIVICAVLVIALIAFLLYMLLRSTDKKKSQQRQTEQHFNSNTHKTTNTRKYSSIVQNIKYYIFCYSCLFVSSAVILFL